MMEARLTKRMLVVGYPPFPWISWTEDAVEMWLREQGFNVDGVLFREGPDIMTGDVVFRQGE